MTLLKDVKK